MELWKFQAICIVKCKTIGKYGYRRKGCGSFPSNRYYISNPELNLVFNSNDWWFDSGASAHVCFDKKKIYNLFSSYQESSTKSINIENGNERRRSFIKIVFSQISFIEQCFACSKNPKNFVSVVLLVEQCFKVDFNPIGL